MTSGSTTVIADVRRTSGPLRRPLAIFLVAAGLRILVLCVVVAHSRVWWGINEAGTIGRLLLLGKGYASPFHDSMGPSAWFSPVYPTLMAGIFLLFGVETTASAWVAALLNVLFASLTALVIRQLGREHFGETAGDIAAWVWAISPPLLIVPWLLWETCLSALALSFAFLKLLRLNEHSRVRDWLLCGCVWAFAGFLNPALLAPLPALGLRALRLRSAKGFSAMLLVCFLGILPWTLRNQLRFHHIFPVRTNLWPELYFSNVTFALHPHAGSMLYQREGEAAFTVDMRNRFLDYVPSHVAEFIRRTGQRVIEFWVEPLNFGPWAGVLSLLAIAGLFLAGFTHREWTAFASVLALYPILYYFTFTFSRFRYPIEPVIYVLAGFAMQELFNWGKERISVPETVR